MGLLEDKGRARRFYRYLAPIYDQVNPFVWTEAMRDDAIGWLDPAPDARVLDVGCGTGFATEGLLERVAEVHGLDLSVHQLKQAWTKLGKHGPASFSLGDAERLPFIDGTFDVVWSSGSIEYWPNPVATLAECRRVTRPGGSVLVVGPAAPRNRLLRAIADAIMFFYDVQDADQLFEAAGFSDVSHQLMQARPGSPRAIVTLACVQD